ncbi:pyridoxal-dependent decarboxylase [Nibrella saemangeumensis]|uniref:Pyridoxal-dependent decarboxylase n=1 Tax=Nibrella saemangeumensis TaxID=1084526 RepID=A0ABP8MVJ2_9BACT
MFTPSTSSTTLLDRLTDEITSFYENPTAVVPQVTAEQIRTHLQSFDFCKPIDAERVFEEVQYMMRNWNVQITHPRYFGLYNPAPLLTAVIAEALAAVYNPQMAAWSHAPAANEIERHTLRHIAQKIGLPLEALACNFTAGGSEANHSAVLVALAHNFPQTLEDGLWALPQRPIIYASELAHNSFDKIVKHTGLGLDGLRIVPVNDSLQMDVNALRILIKQDQNAGRKPFMVVGTAGITATGTIDPLTAIADLCRQYDLWFHVDAAWAGAAVFSDTIRPALAGIELADSVTVDAHKWFNLTMGAGMFFTRHAGSNARAFTVRADYMPPSEEAVSVPYLTTMQWSRRFIGLKLFMALAELGEDQLARMIEYQAGLGAYFREQLKQEGWIVVNETPLPVVNFTHPRIRMSAVSVDGVLTKLYAEGDAWISSVTLRGEKVFRMCITNFKTTRADVDSLMDQLNRLVSE